MAIMTLHRVLLESQATTEAPRRGAQAVTGKRLNAPARNVSDEVEVPGREGKVGLQAGKADSVGVSRSIDIE